MCSQVIHGPQRLCQECEWELESAELAAVGDDDAGARRGAADAGSAQSLPEGGAARADSGTSFKLWRTRHASRAVVLALAASLALAGAVALHAPHFGTHAAVSVMQGYTGPVAAAYAESLPVTSSSPSR
jgi:hypothetical protein